jgi:hypothetical protein
MLIKTLTHTHTVIILDLSVVMDLFLVGVVGQGLVFAFRNLLY